MATSADPMLDNLAGVVQAIAHDKNLLKWFRELAGKSSFERRNAIYAMANYMKNEKEETKFTTSLLLLTDENIFSAAFCALREHGHIK